MPWFDSLGDSFGDMGGRPPGGGGDISFDNPGLPMAPASGGTSMTSPASWSDGPAGGGSGGVPGKDSGASWLTSMGGAAVAGGALAYNLMQGDKTDPNITSLKDLVGQLGPEANAMFAKGNKYMSYLESGTLPPGMDEMMSTQMNAEKARILQNAAHSGLSADPTQNSALTQDLNSLSERMSGQRAQMAQSLLSQGNNMINTGLQFSNLQSNLFKYLADYDLKQSQATGSAISSFAAALGSFGGSLFGGPAGGVAGGAAGKAVGGMLGG